MNYQKLRLEKHATNQRVEFSTLFLHDVERFIGFTQPPFRIIPPLNARQVFGSRVSWCWKQKPAGKIAFRSWFCFARKSVWNRDLALKRRKLPRPEWSDLSAIVFLFRVYFFARFVRVLCVNYYYTGLFRVYTEFRTDPRNESRKNQQTHWTSIIIYSLLREPLRIPYRA